MKLMHISDLHLGKRVHGFSMLDDQQYILDQILRLADEEQPDAVLIAGDVYDKSIPPAEAVTLLDTFLQSLCERNMPVCIISGNHDSAERVAFGAKMMERAGLYIAPVFDGTVREVTLNDAHGAVHIHLLPFLKPAHVRAAFPDADVQSYTDALRHVISQMTIHPTDRNVLLTHQFVTGGVRSESEELSVGGSDNVDADVFAPFDYVALGHLHAPQHVQRESIRYCGSPLKYFFSEKDQIKSVTMVTLREKGSIEVRTLPLQPLHDMREIRGTYEELTLRDNYIRTPTDDYLHIVLTNKNDVPDAVGRLHVIYPNLMKLDYDNARTRAAAYGLSIQPPEQKDPVDLFAEFFAIQNGMELTPDQRKYVAHLFADIREDNAI